MVLVSVVIPTFGRAELLCRAVRSVLDQTVSDLEVVVVIDGDDPATVAALGALNDPRVRHIAHGEKRGAGQARDTGVEHCRGTWVAFLDDDDEWLPAKLERQLRCAEAHDGPAVVMSVSRVVSRYGTSDKPSQIYDNRRPIDEWLFDSRSWARGGESFLQTSSLMMPRALFDDLRFTDTKQHEEWELVIRAVKRAGHALLTDPEPSVIYYVPDMRASLSLTYTWRRSLDWALGVGSLLTPRAFSGFCLTIAAETAASLNDRSAFWPLLRAAFRHGAPTAGQLGAFLLYWSCPTPVRRRIGAMLRTRQRH